MNFRSKLPSKESLEVFDPASDVFCVNFDCNYIFQAKEMLESLTAYAHDPMIFLLALDEEVVSWAKNLSSSRIKILTLDEILEVYPSLRHTRSSRSHAEFIFSLKTFLVDFCLKKNKEISSVSYIDVDVRFYSSVIPIYQELKGYDVGLSPHGFTDKQTKLLRYGQFNAGWVYFRNSENSLEILRYWQGKVIESCEDVPRNGRFAEQKYLDDFPILFKKVRVVENPGVNAGPWSLAHKSIAINNVGKLTVNGHPLIFFHFHGLRFRGNRVFCNLSTYGYKLDNISRNYIFLPYAQSLVSDGKNSPRSQSKGGRGGSKPRIMMRRTKIFAKDLLARSNNDSIILDRKLWK